MASIREIRRRIKSIQKIQQITKAMKMVATVKYKRAYSALTGARPYATKINEIVSDLAERIENVRHPFISKGKDVFKSKEDRKSNKIILVVITGDKGLCGSFNSNILKRALSILNELKNSDISLLLIGKKARDFFNKQNFKVKNTYISLSTPVPYNTAEKIASELINSYLSDGIDDVFLIYNKFKTVMTQTLVYEKLLPISEPKKSYSRKTEHLYEPSSKEIFDKLLPAYIKFRFYSALLESNASEHGARMNMMDQANKNAEDMISGLTLLFNKARQASITKELTEISTSAEAIRI